MKPSHCSMATMGVYNETLTLQHGNLTLTILYTYIVHRTHSR